MAWNRVIKTINGYRYVYEQRTSRHNGRVRTECRYVGPAAGLAGDTLGEQPGLKRSARRILYHGSREGIQGLPRPSSDATYGPGFYLAARDEAEQYARYHPSQVPLTGSSRAEYQGTVHAFDVSALDLLPLETRHAYEVAVRELSGNHVGEITRADRAAAQQAWAAQGYDGLDVRGSHKPAVVVFPSSMFKLGDLIAYYTVAALA